jgi:hypothetical protein
MKPAEREAKRARDAALAAERSALEAAKAAPKSSSRPVLPARRLVGAPTSFRPDEGTPTPPASVPRPSRESSRGGQEQVELWPPGKWQRVEEGGAVLSAGEHAAVRKLIDVALPNLLKEES